MNEQTKYGDTEHELSNKKKAVQSPPPCLWRTSYSSFIYYKNPKMLKSSYKTGFFGFCFCVCTHIIPCTILFYLRQGLTVGLAGPKLTI